MLIPVQTEYFALEGLGQLLNTIKIVRQHLNPDLEIEGVLLTMFDGRLRLSNQVAAEVRRYFGDRVFEAVVQRNVRISEAPSFGKPVLLYDAISSGSRNYMAVAAEVVRNNQRYLQQAPEAADGTPLDDAPALRVPTPAPRVTAPAPPPPPAEPTPAEPMPARTRPASPRLPAGDGDASAPPDRVVLASRATPPSATDSLPRLATSSALGSRPRSCSSSRVTLRTCVITWIMWTGTRMVRLWSATARVMACRIHQVA